jgi:hypothetical protein
MIGLRKLAAKVLVCIHVANIRRSLGMKRQVAGFHFSVLGPAGNALVKCLVKLDRTADTALLRRNPLDDDGNLGLKGVVR